MTESNPEVENAAESQEGAVPTGESVQPSDHGSEGRYIPYSGGSLGWFENSGVLKCEKGNNYKFYTAIDTTLVRQKLFDRWGAEVNKRIDDRVVVDRETPVMLTWESGVAQAVTKDLSSHGLRLQLSEDPDLAKGDKVIVHVKEKEDSETELMVLESEIMWTARVGKRRMVWNIGLVFSDISPEQELELKRFLVS